jgi:hypothetical protein
VKIQLDHVSAEESGDYYQVHFEAADDGDGPYVLIQRQFEDVDGGLCYLETHDQDYIGHFKVVRATLDRNRFCLELRRKKFSKVEVTFKTNEPNYIEVSRILQIMIPCLAVAREGAG